MKILHTADWHIGKKLENFSRIEEQRAILEEIIHISEKENIDAVIISGDLFDTFSPATEAIELFYRSLKKLTNNGKRPVIAIAGNHDSPDRIETADPLARECGILFIGYPNTHFEPFELESGLKVTQSEPGFIELSIPTTEHPLRIITTPYANEHRIKALLDSEDKEAELRNVLQQKWEQLSHAHCNDQGVNILATHLFVIKKGNNIPEEPDDEKPILHVGGAQAIFTEDFPPHIQYAALGHLHRKQIVESTPYPIVYSGSPISYSFAEANQEKHVAIAELYPNQKAVLTFTTLNAGKKLLRFKARDMQEAEEILKSNQEALIELTVETDNYMTAKDRRHLNSIHPGIITLIPQVKNFQSAQDGSKKSVDINKNMNNLFIDYFNTSIGMDPNVEILDLFNEILSE
ncbi:metallophosphoesterase family protein [Plebeiibacterium marinum]|uniref:Nuclease SbcCD subunit D n=1 Tax=Plebeiibacterium marinum TaxID=2992111 RepID=A0AAE3MHH8_9BACT|nr:exonuclease subunit SbcD [Plebeiobacterium marinum]MCW3807711.1 exonuclease subunit SbcD [Plebeiobacterium marinum]